MKTYVINQLKEEPDFMVDMPQLVDGFTCWTYTKMITNLFLYGAEIDKGLSPERRYNHDEYHLDMDDIRALSMIVPEQICLRNKKETATAYGERTLTSLAQMMMDPNFYLYIDYFNQDRKVVRERLVWVGAKDYEHVTSRNQDYLKKRAMCME